jgi:hypothetical protein
MNSEERPATSRTAYLRINNILCLRALSKHILHFLGGLNIRSELTWSPQRRPRKNSSLTLELNPYRGVNGLRQFLNRNLRLSPILSLRLTRNRSVNLGQARPDPGVGSEPAGRTKIR